MAEQQQRLQGLSEEYQKIQQDQQTYISTRQKLESQHRENTGVANTFSKLSEDANIYKLVGPVLLKQERAEAKMAVDARLEFIEGEIKRVERQLADSEEKTDQKRMEIMQLQSQMEGSQAQASGKAQIA